MRWPTIAEVAPHIAPAEVATMVGDLLHAARYVADEDLSIPPQMLEDLRQIRDGELEYLDDTFRDAASEMIARLTQTQTN